MTYSLLSHTALKKRGGAVRVAQLINEALFRDGVHVHHTYEHSENDEPDASQIDHHIDPDQLGHYAKKLHNPVIHVHSTGDWPALMQALPEDIPLVQTIHDAEPLTGGCAYPLRCEHFEKKCVDPCPRNFKNSAQVRKDRVELLKRADVLVTPSRWMAQMVRKTVPDSTVRIIPNGIPWPDNGQDIPRLKRAARQEMGLHPQAKAVLFIAHGGAMAVYKSGDRWEHIWAKLKARVPEAVGYAVGGDSSSRVGDMFTWPYIDRERMRDLMYAADILLYPSLADNHPLVVLEAMSNGLAVVSYSAGGIPEQIKHEETGYLVPEEDEAVLIDAAVNALHGQNIRRIGENAFHQGQNRFNVERMVKSYTRIFDSFYS